MRDDNFDDDEDPSDDVAYDDSDVGPEDFPMLTDFVAERTIAFTYLAERAATFDDDIKEVAVNMLQAIIRSIKTPASASISVAKSHD